MQPWVTVLLVCLLPVCLPVSWFLELISVWASFYNDPHLLCLNNRAHLLTISSSLHTITTPLWSSVPAGSSLCARWFSQSAGTISTFVLCLHQTMFYRLKSWVCSWCSSDKYKTEMTLGYKAELRFLLCQTRPDSVRNMRPEPAL